METPPLVDLIHQNVWAIFKLPLLDFWNFYGVFFCFFNFQECLYPLLGGLFSKICLFVCSLWLFLYICSFMVKLFSFIFFSLKKIKNVFEDLGASHWTWSRRRRSPTHLQSWTQIQGSAAAGKQTPGLLDIHQEFVSAPVHSVAIILFGIWGGNK